MAKKRTSGRWNYLTGVVKEDPNLACDLTQNEIINCKFCGASNLVKYGYSKGVQCWKCKNCHRKFVDNKAVPRMRTPKERIAYALSTYYEGMGFKFICQNLWQKYNCYPSESTFYEWKDRFTKQAIEYSEEDKPQVGKVWIGLVSPIKIGDDHVWFWDIFDVKTRFLLASHVSEPLIQNNARMTLTQAVKRVGQLPKVVFTDGPITWIEGLKLEYNGECRRVIQKNPLNTAGVRILKQFRSNLNVRNIIIKRLKNLNSVRFMIHGWQVHYNYLRPYEILNSCTPAYQANIRRSRLSREVMKYYVNDFWSLWSTTMKFNKLEFP
jgi:putative transposase